ncbi:hypothetical protein KVT40_004124 [Elsinoe batatas]|uniref:SH3 domain-containing protein n=1 Tax=Elsinoe batatas TaxID=2601811 RepID=A0A8K0L5V4_9PEZI|nr:hypothetical protein KVT40_004124 [Elsinoe batatas]
MGGPPQQVPTRFPCWCRAVYSWGGETKRDLGFIEGDLIECLNAGDGSWWTGRLRRDQRAVGLFPSNFVQVLSEDFQPAPISRNISPIPSVNHGTPQKSSSTFRKPFQAYEKLGYKGSENSSREGTPEKEKPKSKWKPYSSMKTAQAPTGTIKKSASSSPLKQENEFRIPSPPARTVARMKSRPHSPAPPSTRARSPAPPGAYRPVSPNPMMRPVSPAIPRAVSPAPSQYRPHSPNPQMMRPHCPNPQMVRSHSPNPQMYRPQSAMDYQQYRAPSPNPNQEYYQQEYHDSRAPSPQPWKQDDYYSRAPSRAFDVGSSPPPPAPPPHRSIYQNSRAPSPAPDHVQQQITDGSHSPAPPHSPGMTPSPLRDAMNEVMSSLHDMSGIAREPSPAPPVPRSVWAPDAFDELATQSHQPSRAHSALGLSRHYQSNDSDSNPSLPPSRDGPPVLSNYVQRMEQRLRHNKSSGMDFSSVTDDTETISDHPPLQQVMRMGTGARRPESRTSNRSESQRQRMALHRKSAYELGARSGLGRKDTTKSSATSSSSGWQSNATTSSSSTSATSQSLMSKSSAGAVSATSAGSLSRRKFGTGSLKSRRPLSVLSSRSQTDLHEVMSRPSRPASPMSGPSYHASHASQSVAPTPVADWTTNPMESAGILGGLSAPKAKKSGFFKKMLATAKTTAKTGAANARSTIGSSSGSRPSSRAGPMVRKSMIPDGVTAISHEDTNPLGSSAHRDMGLGGGSEWMQVRRDVNRSNSLSRNERLERAERCQMLDVLVIKPIEELLDQAEGDESLDGLPVSEPTDFQQPSLALVDKSTRFITAIPPSTTPQALAQTYLCRPFRSDVQRLRAIFTWVSERITWEEDFVGPIETRRVLQTKRGCSEEIANLVRDLCVAVGLHAEVVQGYLKAPDQPFDQDALSRPNHWWNAVLCDGEWRIMDCSLAGPTNPRRGEYSNANNNVAESWWFLARPMEICYTHVPCRFEQQHICPPIAPEILLNLPCACPPYFRHGVEMVDFETSMLHVEGLEMTHLKLAVPEDVECVAEIEARAFARDHDGDLFESGDMVRKPAFAQPQWIGGRKIFTIKAILPGDEGTGVLKIYAGKRGLMHSISSNPHPLALSLAITHSGTNPPFAFHTRHPTPHAQRHDLYVVQPQCHRLVINNTFVFCIRQHPSSLSRFTPDTWGSSNGTNPSSSSHSRSQSSMGIRPVSPNPYARPTSAMSMRSTFSVNTVSASVAGSNFSSGSDTATGGMSEKQLKPAKLAVQSPSGKIIRLTRKQEYLGKEEGGGQGLGSSWETVIKVGERGTWRGLVLADRSARWCVMAEWECI